MPHRQGSAPTTCLKFILTLAIVAFSSLDVHASPDLTGTIVKLKHVISSSSEQLVIKVAIHNIGTDVPIVPVTVALWLSEDARLDADDLLLIENDVDASLVAPDMSTTIKLKKPDMRGIQGRYVFITIDEGDLVAESDETNNIIMQPFTRARCMKDVVLVEREPNDTEDIAQRVGRVNPDTCVRIDGTIDQERRVDRFRVWVDADQTFEVFLSYVIPSDVRMKVIGLELWDVDREEMVGDCGRTSSTSSQHCRLDVATDRVGYPLDILVWALADAGHYQLRINSLERMVDFENVRQFTFAQADGFFPQFHLPSRVVITRIDEMLYEFRLSIFEEGDLVIDDCLSRLTPSRCLIEREVIARMLTDAETQEVFDVFSRLRVTFLPPIICRARGVSVDFVIKHVFTWDDFTAFGITCDVPHVPDDQAKVLFALFKKLKNAE